MQRAELGIARLLDRPEARVRLELATHFVEREQARQAGNSQQQHRRRARQAQAVSCNEAGASIVVVEEAQHPIWVGAGSRRLSPPRAPTRRGPPLLPAGL